nr:class I SAM-dependent methyltransferase [Chloroflexota bacterium]
MLRVVGRRTAPISSADLREEAAGYARTLIDLGTGDGRFVTETARQRPEVFVVGIDANAAGMAEASRRAARPATKGGVPNARFVVASAEGVASELPTFADELHVHFPWGSLLRGLAMPEPDAIRALAELARPGASVVLLLSVTDTDRAVGLAPLDDDRVTALSAAYAQLGLYTLAVRRATDDDLAAARSSWAKRLAAGARRGVWLIRLTRR